jgi:hypothetical protein
MITTDGTSLYNLSGDPTLLQDFGVLRSGFDGLDAFGFTPVAGGYDTIVAAAADHRAGSFDAGYDTPVASDPAVFWIAFDQLDISFATEGLPLGDWPAETPANDSLSINTNDYGISGNAPDWATKW